MTTFTITLAADTNVYNLTAEIPSLDCVSNALRDMIVAGDFGRHTVEIESGCDHDPETEMPITGTGFSILYIASASRAAISNNGGVFWTDAVSVEDAIRRYRADDLAN